MRGLLMNMCVLCAALSTAFGAIHPEVAAGGDSAAQRNVGWPTECEICEEAVHELESLLNRGGCSYVDTVIDCELIYRLQTIAVLNSPHPRSCLSWYYWRA